MPGSGGCWGYRNSKNGAFRSVPVPLGRFARTSSPLAGSFGLDVSTVGLVLHDNLSAQVDKGFVHVRSPPRTGLEIRNIPFT